MKENNPNLDFYGFSSSEPSPNPDRSSSSNPSQSSPDIPPQEENSAAVAAALSRKKEAKKTFSRLGWGIFAAVLSWVVIPNVLILIVSMLNPSLAENTTFRMLLGTLPLYIVSIPLCALIIRKKPAICPKKEQKLGAWFVIFIFISFFFMIVGSLIGNTLMNLIGLLSGEYYTNDLLSTMMAPLPVTFFLTVISAPIFEELLCRKLLLERALPYGEVPAMLFTSLVFALLHHNFYQFFYAFFIGMLLSYLYLRTGRLRYNIILHMIINFVGGILPSLLMKAINPELLESLMEGITELSKDYFMMIMDNIIPVYLLSVFVILEYAAALAGGILFFVFLRKIQIVPQEKQLLRGEKTVIFNSAGCIFMMIAFVGMFIYSFL